MCEQSSRMPNSAHFPITSNRSIINFSLISIPLADSLTMMMPWLCIIIWMYKWYRDQSIIFFPLLSLHRPTAALSSMHLSSLLSYTLCLFIIITNCIDFVLRQLHDPSPIGFSYFIIQLLMLNKLSQGIHILRWTRCWQFAILSKTVPSDSRIWFLQCRAWYRGYHRWKVLSNPIHQWEGRWFALPFPKSSRGLVGSSRTQWNLFPLEDWTVGDLFSWLN